jgi:outer membrane scaffolding protein for murein synthesis (MipA/OmpV family)
MRFQRRSHAAALALGLAGGLMIDLGPVAAQAPDEGDSHGDAAGSAWTVGLGLGAFYGPDYEGSDDLTVTPLPFILVQYRDLAFFRGDEFGANLLHAGLGGGEITAGPLASFVFPRDEDDNDALEGLGDVDFSFEVGGFVTYALAPWEGTLSVLQDVAGGHGGLIATLEGGRDIELTPTVGLSLGLSTSFADGTYMNSYFTIDGDQAAASGLDAFDASSGFKDVSASLKLAIQLTDHWSLTNLLLASRLLGDAADSPIVDDEGSPNQFQVGTLLTYVF